jgi:HD-like signal output (HDOD) protein
MSSRRSTVRETGVYMNRMVQPEPNPKNLGEWVRRLTSRDMPIFSQTAHKISVISAMTQSHAAELANAILQDALLTTRILKMANSAFYVRGRQGSAGNSVNTVTRAVMVLGFDTIRAICQTKAVVEDLLKGIQRECLTQKMACSFHAAAQARWLAVQTQDESPEEIFIATFLYLLGEMAFWCFADEASAGELEKMRTASETDQDRAVEDILGFHFGQLTLALNKEWRLGALLLEALEQKNSANPRLKKIFWGHQLARAARKGWNSAEAVRLIDQAADSLTLPRAQVVRMVQENAREAIQTAVSYGAAQAGRLIPVPPAPAGSIGLDGSAEADLVDEGADHGGPDPALQLKILHDLSTQMLDKKPDYSVFISLVLEGIFRAVGLDRVLFALCTPDRSRLEIKFQLGWSETEAARPPIFEPIPLANNLFAAVLGEKQPRWFKSPSETGENGLGNDPATRWIGAHPFFIMPIVVYGKSLGLIYADRQRSGRGLDEESYQGFQHFGLQATIGLSLITKKEAAP